MLQNYILNHDSSTNGKAKNKPFASNANFQEMDVGQTNSFRSRKAMLRVFL